MGKKGSSYGEVAVEVSLTSDVPYLTLIICSFQLHMMHHPLPVH